MRGRPGRGLAHVLAWHIRLLGTSAHGVPPWLWAINQCALRPPPSARPPEEEKEEEEGEGRRGGGGEEATEQEGAIVTPTTVTPK